MIRRMKMLTAAGITAGVLVVTGCAAAAEPAELSDQFQVGDIMLEADLAEARQTVALDRKPSAGHVVLVPLQVSATSQAPFAARQTAPVLPALCVHEPAWQTSTVQALLSLVHAAPFAFGTGAEHRPVAGWQVPGSAHSLPLVQTTAEPFVWTQRLR